MLTVWFVFFVYTLFNLILVFCSCVIVGIGVALLLQASLLLGFTLISWIALDKLHDIIKEHHSIRDIIKAEEILLQERKLQQEDHRKVLQGKVAELTAKRKKLEMDCQMRTNRAQDAGAIVSELIDLLEEFHHKYDSLLDYNQALQNQLQSISHEAQKLGESDGWSNMISKLGCPAVENNGESVDFENATETTDKCGEYLFSATHSSSSPRHRRPIYQF